MLDNEEEIMFSSRNEPIPYALQDKLNSIQYILDQTRDAIRDQSAETNVLLRIAWKIVEITDPKRVFESGNTPAHVVVLFLKNIISFEAMLKVLSNEHNYTNFELIKVTEKFNEYLPKERRV